MCALHCNIYHFIHCPSNHSQHSFFTNLLGSYLLSLKGCNLQLFHGWYRCTAGNMGLLVRAYLSGVCPTEFSGTCIIWNLMGFNSECSCTALESKYYKWEYSSHVLKMKTSVIITNSSRLRVYLGYSECQQSPEPSET